MNDLEVRQLRYFVAVAEELHFGRAAGRRRLRPRRLHGRSRRAPTTRTRNAERGHLTAALQPHDVPVEY